MAGAGRGKGKQFSRKELIESVEPSILDDLLFLRTLDADAMERIDDHLITLCTLIDTDQAFELKFPAGWNGRPRRAAHMAPTSVYRKLMASLRRAAAA